MISLDPSKIRLILESRITITIADLRVVSLRERWEFLRVYGAAAGLEEDRCRHLWRRGRTQQLRRLSQ